MSGSDSLRSPADLEELQSDLDRIDDKLLKLLRDRIACCAHIADYKRQRIIPMTQSQRVTTDRERAARCAKSHGFSELFLQQLCELVDGEMRHVQDQIMSAARTELGGRTHPDWLLEEYW